MATVISLFAKKGGVGKTTLSLNLAGYLASQNYRVLLIDSDPQASLSQGLLGADKVEQLQKSNTVSALFDEVVEPNPKAIVQEIGCERIWLAPASDLLQPYSHPDPLSCGEMQFAYRNFIAEVSSLVDYVICDAPPDCANLLSWNCLMASQYVLTPVNMETYSAQSVAGVIRKIDEAHRNGNPNLQSLGYVVNLRDKRTALHEANEKRFRQIYGPQVFQTVLYNWIAVAEAQHRKTHIFGYADSLSPAKRKSILPAEQATSAFGAELLERIQPAARRAA